MRHQWLLACLILSGFSGLAYELLWVRLLSFAFGSTALSFSAVVAVFFGGLALGAWLAGRRAASLARPVRVYAFVELGTAVAALALYPALLYLDRVFVGMDPGSGLGGALVRLLFATPLLIVPTVLMGATLPIVCAAMIVRDEASGRGMARIYGFNTLGAFLGAYLITYHLIPGVGVFRSFLAAALVNVLAGALALFSEDRERQKATAASSEVEPVPGVAAAGVASATPLESSAAAVGSSSAVRKVALLAPLLTFVGGFAYISLEVVWARLFSSFLKGTIYGIGAVLICFLLGIALGSLLLARRMPKSSDLGFWFAATQTGAVASVLLLFAGLPRIAYWLASLEGGVASQHAQLFVVFLALMVPTACSGASFPMLVKLVEERARHTGRALGSMYAANTVGSILGSLVTGFVLIPEVGSSGAAGLALASLALTAALSGALLPQDRQRFAGFGVAAVGLLLVFANPGFDPKLIATSAGSGGQQTYAQYIGQLRNAVRRIVYFAEGRDGTVAVFDGPDTRSLTINGLGQGGRKKLPPYHILESLLVAAVPLAHAQDPQNALVVGLGAGITVDFLREAGVPEVTVVEIEPRVLGAVKVVYLGGSPAESPGVRVVVDDARHFLLRSNRRADRRYDLITSMPAHPWVAPGLFTREFFALAASSLSEEGVFSTWFGVGDVDPEVVKSLFRAFCSVFPHYVAYRVPETGSYYLVGSRRPLSFEMDRIRSLHSNLAMREHDLLGDPFFLPVRVYATGDAPTDAPAEGVMNTDDSAFVETQAPRTRSERPKELEGFLPREYLSPEMLPSHRRSETYVELLERLLGTPDGLLPLRPSFSHIGRARLMTEAAHGLVSASALSYFRGRVALASNDLEKARLLLEQTAAGTGEFADRARKFRALTFPRRSAARLEALMELKPSPDVIAEALAINVDRALSRVPKAAVSPEEEPLGWFLWKAATTSPGQLSAEDRQVFRGKVAKLAYGSWHLGLLVLAERFSREQTMDQAAEVLGNRRRAVATGLAQSYFDEGVAAGNRGEFQKAAEALWNANQVLPGNELGMHALLRALAESGDKTRMAALLAEFRVLGKSEYHIEALQRAAQGGTLAFAAPEGSVAAAEPSGPEARPAR